MPHPENGSNPLEGHTSSVDCQIVVFLQKCSPHGRDTTVRFRSKCIYLVSKRLEGYTDVVKSATFSSDDTKVITASFWDKTVQLLVWDAAYGKDTTNLRRAVF